MNKEEILIKSGEKCFYCDHPLTIRTMHIEHMIPRSRGGTDGDDNLVAACPSCNTEKRNRTPDEWSPVKKIVPGDGFIKRLSEWKERFKSNLVVVKTDIDLDKLSQMGDEKEAITALVKTFGTLRAVSNNTGINQGYLSQIASGKRKASNKTRILLGLNPRE